MSEEFSESLKQLISIGEEKSKTMDAQVEEFMNSLRLRVQKCLPPAVWDHFTFGSNFDNWLTERMKCVQGSGNFQECLLGINEIPMGSIKIPGLLPINVAFDANDVSFDVLYLVEKTIFHDDEYPKHFFLPTKSCEIALFFSSLIERREVQRRENNQKRRVPSTY
jgi:hypothetical protein